MFKKIEIKRERSRSKVKAYLYDSNTLFIAAPQYFSDKDCVSFLEKNRAALERLKKRELEFEEKKREFDGAFLYFGEKKPIVITKERGKKYSFCQKEGLMLSSNEAFREFLRDEAKRFFPPKVEELAGFYGVSYDKITLRDTKSRWGSCSAKKRLSFSTRLIGAPRSVIEYVIIHELCHLKELNHSRKFWSHVSALLPNYKESERWLKENGRLLYLR